MRLGRGGRPGITRPQQRRPRWGRHAAHGLAQAPSRAADSSRIRTRTLSKQSSAPAMNITLNR
eukprot:1377368-Pleurochrysis_carterae.AAC.1